MRSWSRLFAVSAVLVLIAAVVPHHAAADHRWEQFHWARKKNPMRITIIDNMTPAWDARLAAINADWNVSAVIQNSIVADSTDRGLRKSCPAVAGKIRTCNSNYGATGWLGLATITTYGNHIGDGTVKANEYYFRMTAYDTEAARRHVFCQELGHVFGLDHNHGSVTCLNDLDGLNNPSYQQPNQHDYNMLDTIYRHLDGSTTIAKPGSSDTESAARRPDPVGPGRGGSSIFRTDLGGGAAVFTFVFWADENQTESGPDQSDDAATVSRSLARALVANDGVAQAPAAPAGLMGTATESGVRLTWLDLASDEVDYRVYRSSDGGSFGEMIATLEPGATTFLDHDAHDPTTYTYTIAAGNTAGQSWSAPTQLTLS